VTRLSAFVLLVLPYLTRLHVVRHHDACHGRHGVPSLLDGVEAVAAREREHCKSDDQSQFCLHFLPPVKLLLCVETWSYWATVIPHPNPVVVVAFGVAGEIAHPTPIPRAPVDVSPQHPLGRADDHFPSCISSLGTSGYVGD
jgi:hypothetical protein